MSESSGAETSAAAAVTGKSGGTRRQIVPQLGHPNTGRVLVAVGATLFAFAAWLPWWIVPGVQGIYGPGIYSPANLDPGQFPALAPLDVLFSANQMLAAWSAVTVIGVLLVGLLWQRNSSVGLRAALGATALWALLATWISVAFWQAVSGGSLPPTIHVSQGSTASFLAGSGPGVGLWLSLSALLLTWVGEVVLALAELRRHGGALTPPARLAESQKRWRGSGWLTAGIFVWALGFLLMPWGTVNCRGIPLTFGTCLGVSGSSAFQAGIYSGRTYYDQLAAMYAGAFVLTGGGILLLSALLLRVSAPALRAWSWLWLLAALGIAVVAYNGVGAIMASPGTFQLPQGTWQGATGLWMTFLGLILALVGLVWLSVSAWRAKQAAR
jgi:hypothetical protein